MRLTHSQLYVLMLGIVALAIGLVTNIATNQIPETVKPYLWYSWPLLLGLVIVFIILSVKREKQLESPQVSSIDVKAYYAALLRRYRTLDLDALTPPQREEYLQLQLRAIFVEQSVRENPPPIELPKEILEKLQTAGELKPEDLPDEISIDEIRESGDRYYKNPSRPVIDVLTGSQTLRAVVLGDPGSGKSTLARYVMLSLVDSEGDVRIRETFRGCLPILIELRTYSALREERKSETFLDYLEFLGKTEGWNFNQTALHEALLTNGSIVIFDGLDEVFEPSAREHVSRSIVGFSRTYPKANILVTSRIVGYQRRVLTDGGFSHYTLQDLDREQVNSFINRWYDLALADRPDDANKRKARILESFDQSASVRQLAGNPMLLTIMAIIGKHQELPRERWKLYDHAASVLIEHWDVKRHLESLDVDAPFIGEDDKKELLRRLAHRMQAGDAGLRGNYIYKEQLQQEFGSYLKERFALPPDRATTISRSMIEQFRHRNFILSLYGASVYGFVHRAFLEYFCATAFTYRFEKTREMTTEQLAGDVFGVHWKDESWHEVLRLISGMVDERFAGKLVTHLLQTDGESETSVALDLLKLELAVRCLGEVRNLNSVAGATNLAMESIVKMFAGRTESFRIPLSNDLLTKLLLAVETIGPLWPNRLRVASLLREFQCPKSFMYSLDFGKFIASIGSGLDEVKDELIAYALHEDKNLRSIWPLPLVTGWKTDENTFQLLRNQIVHDSDGYCRSMALRAFVSNYGPNAETLLIARERLEKDTDEIVRYYAIRHLATSDDPSVVPLLRHHLSYDLSLVKFFCLSELARRLSDEAVVTLILEKVPKEAFSMVRDYMYDVLDERRGKDSRVRAFLLDRLKTEHGPNSRNHILNVLATSFGADPEVREALHNCSKQDSDPTVRARASKLTQQLKDSEQHRVS